jgi:ketosteroid isomerase-like protein
MGAPAQNRTGSGQSANRADAQAIHQTVADFVAAWNKHDAHAFEMTFTEDADFTNVAGVHAQGRANVEGFHAPRFASYFKDSHQTAAVRSIRMLTAPACGGGRGLEDDRGLDAGRICSAVS